MGRCAWGHVGNALLTHHYIFIAFQPMRCFQLHHVLYVRGCPIKTTSLTDSSALEQRKIEGNNNYVFLNFVVTPRNFIIAKLSIRKPGSSSVLIISSANNNSTDEDPGLRIESFAIIKLRGVTTKFKNIFFIMQTFKELITM